MTDRIFWVCLSLVPLAKAINDGRSAGWIAISVGLVVGFSVLLGIHIGKTRAEQGEAS